MERKILVEVTEEEYEKIKDGIFEKEPEVITEIKEVKVVEEKIVPVVKDKQFKFGLGKEVSFGLANVSDSHSKEYKGTIVGFLLTSILLSGEIAKELVPLYQIKYWEYEWKQFNYVWLEEKDITLISKENADESK